MNMYINEECIKWLELLVLTCSIPYGDDYVKEPAT